MSKNQELVGMNKATLKSVIVNHSVTKTEL